MPAGVWARSVSASEIEVNWQAVSLTPERVLGYEVRFTLGKWKQKSHNSNACHHPCCTSEPSLPKLRVVMAMAVSVGRLLQPKLYSSLWRHDRKTCQSVFIYLFIWGFFFPPENKRKLPVRAPFHVAVAYGIS